MSYKLNIKTFPEQQEWRTLIAIGPELQEIQSKFFKWKINYGK